jgi:molybdate transport system substrate-binding protein
MRILMLFFFMVLSAAQAQEIRVAAASDLQFAMPEIIAAFQSQNPKLKVTVSYGSSGRFDTQIRQGAPFDIFFSADDSFTKKLEQDGFLEANSRKLYAIGRVAVWVANRLKLNVAQLGVKVLLDPSIAKIAIANPEHAPYGVAAISLLEFYGLEILPKLVYAENIAQAAQIALAGADAGILALSVVKNPTMQNAGSYWLAPLNSHTRLNQQYAILKSRATPAVRAFYAFIQTLSTRKILNKYGFQIPNPAIPSSRL